MEQKEKDIIQIDPMYLLRKLWNKKLVIAVITLFFTAAALAYSLFVVTPKYNSTTRVYVVNQKNNNQAITAQDVQLGTLLVKDYKEIILSKDVIEKVANEESNLGISADQISKKISVDAPKDTRIISITATDKDPQVASALANAVKRVSADKIKEVTKIEDVTTLEEAKPATAPSSPNVAKNGILGFAAGLLISVAGVVLLELLDDRVRRPEDVEESLNMVLLGTIPNTSTKK